MPSGFTEGSETPEQRPPVAQTGRQPWAPAVYQSDAVALMAGIPDNAVNLFLTDIPYQRVNKPSGGLRKLDKTYANELDFSPLQLVEQAVRITKGNAVIFCGKEQFSELYQYCDENGLTTRMIIWEKTNPMPMNGQRVLLSGVECAVHFRKPKATYHGHCRNTVFRYPNGSSRRHPTEKPLALFKELIQLMTNPKDLVCDPCVGAGTTAVACQELDRQFIVGDNNPECIQTTNHRLRMATEQ